MKRERVFDGVRWESEVGYCRAVRAGRAIAIAGCAPVGDDGQVVAPGDAYAQARRCCEIVARALERLGAPRSSLTRTRLYVTDITRFADYGRAHAEFFGAHPPACTMVEVRRLIDPAMLVELEADALLDEE